MIAGVRAGEWGEVPGSKMMPDSVALEGHAEPLGSGSQSATVLPCGSNGQGLPV